jgi:FAD/FMN-containing dehydrogenase
MSLCPRSRLHFSDAAEVRMTARRDDTVEHVDDLRRSLAGTVLTPADAQYETARRCFNALVDRRPALIVRCLGSDDVATAFDFARTHELQVAVRGGGHNPAGHCVLDDGLVIDLTAMRRVDVEPDRQIAHAQGGATWLDFDSATQAFGLATPGGVVGSTGVTGLTLGGGIGHLTAQHGLTCDNIVGAELVTPSGSVVHASADENAELLWGLRGGGGNFGVATRLDFRLHALERVVGGMLEYRGNGVGDVLRRFRDIVSRSPRDLSCQAVIGLDDSLTPALVVAPCYTSPAGDPDELRELRAAPGLVSDGVRAQTFLEQQLVFDSPYGENRHYWKGHFVRELSDELIDELLQRIVAFRRPPPHVLVESLHGAPKEADGQLGPIAYRQASFNVSAMAVWSDPDEDEQHIAWARETAAAIEPWSLGGGYANYMQADEPLERVRAAFGDGAFERLQALKTQFDPANVLRRNQNIPPRAVAL